jgi:hypothetical protein
VPSSSQNDEDFYPPKNPEKQQLTISMHKENHSSDPSSVQSFETNFSQSLSE